MNFVFIMTDTQGCGLVGAYGNPGVQTPNLDCLAGESVRFERAYTSCPLCTPARSGIFSGTPPPVNGAWCNNVAPYPTYPLMGTILRHYGYRAAYTGKWHLDGSGYFGDGEPGGGFEPDWWFDGKRYAEAIGPDRFKAYRTCRTADDLRATGFKRGTIWGHQVANRAIDFLRQAGKGPFVLVVSLDEPHSPFVAPPECWESFDASGIPRRPNFGAPVDGKPELQRIHRETCGIDPAGWEDYRRRKQRYLACNAYIDHEIGRVLEAVRAWHNDTTAVIYTSDHGDMMGAHGLESKGPMMYEETIRIPLMIRVPGGAPGAVAPSPVSHLDLLPTMLDLAGLPVPESLPGFSLRPILADPGARVRDCVPVSFTRFAINHDDWGGFYPIRCVTDGIGKLAINLLDTDEYYDLASDPFELHNAIRDPRHADRRDRLHDWLLDEMDRGRDPFRSHAWGARAWRTVRRPFYHGGRRRNPPLGFPFQPVGLEADGTGPGLGRAP